MNPQLLSQREKLMLVGLFLAKFNEDGVRALGFATFVEVFNVFGYALASRPASIKNYRDEFDPFFPGGRKGWHMRPIRKHCEDLLHRFRNWELKDLTELILAFVGGTHSVPAESPAQSGESLPVAQRLITGLAAERYFQAVRPDVPEFSQYTLEDTTRFGCGYDFRLWPQESSAFIAVEVKGIHARSGNISMTQKEFDTASSLADRFVLFVVKNFQDKPYHEIHRNPLVAGLNFSRRERAVIDVSWVSRV